MTLALPHIVADRQLRDNFDQIALQFPIGASQLQSAATVTTLPTAPVNGQEVYYVADATNGIVWHLKYRSASASAYKWEFVGGPSLFAEIATNETTASTTYVALATAGPTVTVPLAGDYDVEISLRNLNSGAGLACLRSFSIGATAAVDADAAVGAPAVGSTDSFCSLRYRRKTALAASTALAAKYRVTGGTGSFITRAMQVTPVRVG